MVRGKPDGVMESLLWIEGNIHRDRKVLILSLIQKPSSLSIFLLHNWVFPLKNQLKSRIKLILTKTPLILVWEFILTPHFPSQEKILHLN